MLVFRVFLLLACGAAIGATKGGCDGPVPESHRLELGAGLHTLIPDKLPDLSAQFFGYGPLISVAVGDHAIQAQGLYGSHLATTVVLGDIAARLNLKLPHFTGFLLLGGHVLHYRPPGTSHTFFGPNGGLGFTFHLSRNLDVHLGMRVYFQNRRLITFGAGIAYLI